ncbi:nitrate reductase molybdenum cofactor assembly chaperone, partial [Streptomyces hayashii]
YRHVLAALLTLLPPSTEADRAAVALLVAEGPPNEEVGLDPYGTYGEGEFAPPGTFVPPTAAAPTRVPAAGPRTTPTEGAR